MSPLDSLTASIRPLRDRLAAHEVYARVGSIGALRVFMEHHVFAVWDFMSLLKALQRGLSCVEVPWVPRGDGRSRRLINAIVLAEESDEDGRGGVASHFEMYRDAMIEAGADMGPIAWFLQQISMEIPALDALAAAPAPARRFTEHTLKVAMGGSLPMVASAFALGREEVIPTMFRALVDRTGGLGRFKYYLDRHIDLDGDEHTPMALAMLSTVCGDDPGRWREAREAARSALEARLSLWDGVVSAIDARGL